MTAAQTIAPILTGTEPVLIGADIGQKHDPTAIVVVEAWQAKIERADSNHVWPKFDFETRYAARRIQRIPLNTAYPDIADRIAEITLGVLDREPPKSRRVRLLVDSTGVGAPVVDLVRRALRHHKNILTEVSINGTERLDGTLRDKRVSLGKAYLVSRLQALLQTAAIQLPSGDIEAEAMANELQKYEIKVNANAHAEFGAFRTGTHDDLVTALGLATLFDPFKVGGQVFTFS